MQKNPDAISRREITALASTAQPVFLIGAGRFARRSAVQRIHKEMVGIALDFELPHPDLSLLFPQSRTETSSAKSIGIDAIKTFVDRLTLTPCVLSLRIGFIEPASALTPESQNALLRYIEEPTRSTRLIFSSRRLEDLIPTLLSRCLHVRLAGALSEAEESAVLAEHYGEAPNIVGKIYNSLDDPDALEKILELRLGRNAVDLYDAVSSGILPDSKTLAAFSEKKPAGECAHLFVEIVFSAVVARWMALSAEKESPAHAQMLNLARRLLVLQTELRYNPQRSVVLTAVTDWLKSSIKIESDHASL